MTESALAALLDSQPEAFARHLLEQHRLPHDPLGPNHGWSNQVWLAPAHVVRLSSGRFRDSFAHERTIIDLLPPEVPHAAVRGYGRVGRREWLIQDRAPGIPLSAAWPDIDRAQRQTAIEQLSEALRALHAIPMPEGFDNPWLRDAIAPDGNRGDAYHLAPNDYGVLLDACRAAPGSDRALLARCGAFIAERLHLFDDDRPVLVHSDLHFENLLWDGGRLTAILDFEGAHPAPADAELETLLRFAREPWLYQRPSSPLVRTPTTLREIPSWLAEAYPGLFARPELSARQAVYEVLWWLVQSLHFRPGDGPVDPHAYLRAVLEAGERWQPW